LLQCRCDRVACVAARAACSGRPFLVLSLGVVDSKTSSTAQPGQGRGLTATSMRTMALLSTAWAARLIRAGRAASKGWRRRLCARPCFVISRVRDNKNTSRARQDQILGLLKNRWPSRLPRSSQIKAGNPLGCLSPSRPRGKQAEVRASGHQSRYSQ
jgi:hypothetical protein